MIYPFSTKLRIRQYPKTLQEAVDVRRKVKFKEEKNNNKSNTKKTE